MPLGPVEVLDSTTPILGILLGFLIRFECHGHCFNVGFIVKHRRPFLILPWLRIPCLFAIARLVGWDSPWGSISRTCLHSLASIQKILNLNHDVQPPEDSSADQSTQGLITNSTPILNEDGDPIWKVLVFDGMGRDVISSVLRVNDLRAWGVTIHLYAIHYQCRRLVCPLLIRFHLETSILLAIQSPMSLPCISLNRHQQTLKQLPRTSRAAFIRRPT